jgi:hypothetical protein
MTDQTHAGVHPTAPRNVGPPAERHASRPYMTTESPVNPILDTASCRATARQGCASVRPPAINGVRRHGPGWTRTSDLPIMRTRNGHIAPHRTPRIRLRYAQSLRGRPDDAGRLGTIKEPDRGWCLFNPLTAAGSIHTGPKSAAGRTPHIRAEALGLDGSKLCLDPVALSDTEVRCSIGRALDPHALIALALIAAVLGVQGTGAGG